VRVTGVPENLQTGGTDDGMSLRGLFGLCVGRTCRVICIAEGMVELEVGEVVGRLAYKYSI
jgi:hypothetical protein